MTAIDHMDLFIAQKGRCFYCEMPMAQERYGSGKKKGYTVDHFIPKILKMGKHLKYNHVLAHRSCNGRKGHELPTDNQISKFHMLILDAIKRKVELKNVPKGGPKEVNNEL